MNTFRVLVCLENKIRESVILENKLKDINNMLVVMGILMCLFFVVLLVVFGVVHKQVSRLELTIAKEIDISKNGIEK